MDQVAEAPKYKLNAFADGISGCSPATIKAVFYKAGTTTYTYNYDINGNRISKTGGGLTKTYTYVGGKLTAEGRSDGSKQAFTYDESGNPYQMAYNDGTRTYYYYYITNLQGDVTQLVDASYNVVATYEYTAWGEIISKSGAMADINPLRYRGYYYDNETGLYYLQSRYYDPATCRFVNGDRYVSTGQGLPGM